MLAEEEVEEVVVVLEAEMEEVVEVVEVEEAVEAVVVLEAEMEEVMEVEEAVEVRGRGERAHLDPQPLELEHVTADERCHPLVHLVPHLLHLRRGGHGQGWLPRAQGGAEAAGRTSFLTFRLF